MRREIAHWWEQALEDLDTARYNSAGGKLYAAAFFCHQAVEKALKALYMAQSREPPPPTHSLHALAKLVKAPPRYRSFLRQLTAEYVLSRYPNVTEDVPARLYDPETLDEYIAQAAEVLEWVRSSLNP